MIDDYTQWSVASLLNNHSHMIYSILLKSIIDQSSGLQVTFIYIFMI